MQILNRNFKFLVILLLLSISGFSQNNQKVEKILISPPEMKSTSAVVIHFMKKGSYVFQIIKDEEVVFSKDLLKVKQISFKIDFSEYEFGQYRIVIMDKRNNLIYDKIHIKK